MFYSLGNTANSLLVRSYMLYGSNPRGPWPDMLFSARMGTWSCATEHTLVHRTLFYCLLSVLWLPLLANKDGDYSILYMSLLQAIDSLCMSLTISLEKHMKCDSAFFNIVQNAPLCSKLCSSNLFYGPYDFVGPCRTSVAQTRSVFPSLLYSPKN